jgi:hypothetical protein
MRTIVNPSEGALVVEAWADDISDGMELSPIAASKEDVWSKYSCI